MKAKYFTYCVMQFSLENNKNSATKKKARFIVTSCLYLIPNDSARSLSTLIAIKYSDPSNY